MLITYQHFTAYESPKTKTYCMLPTWMHPAVFGMLNKLTGNDKTQKLATNYLRLL